MTAVKFPFCSFALLLFLLPPASAADTPPGLSSTDSVLVAPARNPLWAVPLDVAGLPNLHKVTDSLYRGAQPTADGFRNLEEMGVKTVLNLRALNSDRDLLAGSNLAYEDISFKTWHPEDEDVVKFLKIVTDPLKAPVFVHCQHGADRTGMMLAVYRVVIEGWSKDDAIEEMTKGGYGYHSIWKEIIEYVRELDVDKIKREAGLDAPAT